MDFFLQFFLYLAVMEDLIDKVKQAFTPPVIDEQSASETKPTSWDTFVESMDSARRKAEELLTIPESSSPAATAATGASSGTEISTAVKSWWSDATAFFEETRISVEEKISEMTGPTEIKNDPLKNLRTYLATYTDVLEQLKKETFSMGMAAENMSRVGSGGLGRALSDCFNQDSTVKDHFTTYKEKHEKVLVPILEEVKSGVENISALIAEESIKIQSILTRFKRRDRLHRSLLDMKSRVDIKRDKNNRKVADGLVVDSKTMEELYELTRTMDSIEADFRITSEQLVNKCSELIKNRSKSFHAIFLKVIEIQNTFFYRIGGSCSIPFADMLEAFKNDEPSEDEMEDLGPHALTWRDNAPDLAETKPAEPAEFLPLKTAPLRRATVSINKTDLTTSPPSGLTTSALNSAPSPGANRFSYRRAGGSVSPMRRAGTSALLEEVPSPK